MLPSSIYGGQVLKLDFFILMQRLVFKKLGALGLIFILLKFGIGQVSADTPLVKCWEFSNKNLSSFGYASDNRSEIYLSTNNGTIIAIDLHGNTLWKSETGGEIISDLVYSEKKIYYLLKKEINKETKFSLHCISSETGINKWGTSLSAGSTGENIQLSVSKESVILSSKTSILLFFEKDSGHLTSEYKNNSQITSNIIVNSDDLFFFTLNGLERFSITKQNLKNLGHQNQKVNSIFDVDQKGILLSTNSGYLTFVDKTNGAKIWSNRVGASLSTVSKSDDLLIVSSLDNYLYRFSTKSGDMIWRRRLETRMLSDLFISEGLIISSLINERSTIFSEVVKGKVINQVLIDSEQFFINKPLIINNKIILFNNEGAVKYEFGNCVNKKE